MRLLFSLASICKKLAHSSWVNRLYSTLGEIIDEDGIASENTPIYQIFYVMLLDDIVLFIEVDPKVPRSGENV